MLSTMLKLTGESPTARPLPPDQALTGRFWNGAIQNYWNEIADCIAGA